MTPYLMVWEPVAESMLADVWMDSANPNSVTVDQAESDRLLSLDPFQHGRLLSEGLYRIQVGSLLINFEVAVDARIVIVTWVRPSA